jgi:hypothetical protein
MAVLVNPTLPVDGLRAELFAGHFVILTELQSVDDLVAHTKQSLLDLFAPDDPEHVHDHRSPEDLARLVGPWKPRFIHDPISKRFVGAIVEEAGFDRQSTYAEVPKPRTSFPKGHLNSGAAFGFPWHRDLWYSAPPQQINWWLPVYPLREDNAMGFDPACFASSVPNDSHLFDYYENNRGRRTTATLVDHEVQARPGALHHHDVPSELVFLPPPGAILLFSGAQLHRTIPNTSGLARYSVDFRTVDARDLAAGRGAPSVDARCTGTGIREFRNIGDDRPFEEDVVVRLFGRPPPGAMLVYEPDDAAGRLPARPD